MADKLSAKCNLLLQCNNQLLSLGPRSTNNSLNNTNLGSFIVNFATSKWHVVE